MSGAGAITIELAGDPVAKGRPRFVRSTGHAYQPEKTRRFEDALRYAAGEVMAGRPPLDCAIDLTVSVFLPVPASWSGKRQREALAGAILPAKRPDADNFLKAAQDSLNMIVYRDDAQVVTVALTKRYSDRPRLVIEVCPTPVSPIRTSPWPLFTEAPA